mmetsp:Transcript_24604/g.93007  ORF Transcript_24604/g.93007 Transcript_24604/m.93007 type:complete len:328 (-) Transcript_24604:4495-5478(-)
MGPTTRGPMATPPISRASPAAAPAALAASASGRRLALRACTLSIRSCSEGAGATVRAETTRCPGFRTRLADTECFRRMPGPAAARSWGSWFPADPFLVSGRGSVAEGGAPASAPPSGRDLDVVPEGWASLCSSSSARSWLCMPLEGSPVAALASLFPTSTVSAAEGEPAMARGGGSGSEGGTGRTASWGIETLASAPGCCDGLSAGAEATAGGACPPARCASWSTHPSLALAPALESPGGACRDSGCWAEASPAGSVRWTGERLHRAGRSRAPSAAPAWCGPAPPSEAARSAGDRRPAAAAVAVVAVAAAGGATAPEPAGRRGADVD